MKTWCAEAGRGVARRGAILAALWLALAAAAAWAQQPADPVADGQKQLQDLKSEIEANRREIDRLKSREKNISRMDERIRRDRELTQAYLQQLGRQDEAIRSDLAGRQASLLEKELELSRGAERLKNGLVRYYKIRRVAGPELLFSSATFGELFARSQFIARLIYRSRLDLEAVALERMQVAREAAGLETRRLSVEQLQAEKKREEERLRRQSQAARAELGELRDARSERERRVRELEESQAAIRRMIERLERERAREGEGGRPLAFSGSLAPHRGRLRWPVAGAVVGEFGFEVNPRYGTRVPQNGIDISAAEGTPIRAVAPGRAVYVDWLPGYGRTVILDHGSGYYTLYAHAATVSVRRGEEVRDGQSIGTVGDTDSIKGFCLHFEVRQGERALDPRDWLSR